MSVQLWKNKQAPEICGKFFFMKIKEKLGVLVHGSTVRESYVHSTAGFSSTIHRYPSSASKTSIVVLDVGRVLTHNQLKHELIARIHPGDEHEQEPEIALV